MEEFVFITENEDEEGMELPLEPDNTLALSTVQAQFPSATGIKYRPQPGATFRGVRLIDGFLHPPADHADGWFDKIFIVNLPRETSPQIVCNKRKLEDHTLTSTPMNATREEVPRKRLAASHQRQCNDLVCLGLPYSLTLDDFKQYFSQFGPVAFAESTITPNGQSSSNTTQSTHYSLTMCACETSLGSDRVTLCVWRGERDHSKGIADVIMQWMSQCRQAGAVFQSVTLSNQHRFVVSISVRVYWELKTSGEGKSRGYGFIRFVHFEDQQKVVGRHFVIGGRIVQVRLPDSKQPSDSQQHDQPASSIMDTVIDRVFIGRLTPKITKQDLNDYFGTFGILNDVFYDQGKKPYAFITFEDPSVAARVISKHAHYIKDTMIIASNPTPKSRGGGGADSIRGNNQAGINHSQHQQIPRGIEISLNQAPSYPASQTIRNERDMVASHTIDPAIVGQQMLASMMSQLSNVISEQFSTHTQYSATHTTQYTSPRSGLRPPPLMPTVSSVPPHYRHEVYNVRVEGENSDHTNTIPRRNTSPLLPTPDSFPLKL